MSQDINVVETALETIASAQLTPTEHLLLKDFVQNAVDPRCAAQHVLQRIESYPGKSTEGALRDLKADWRKLTDELTRVAKVPPRLQTLVRRRDGPQCSLKESSDHTSYSGQAEFAYIIPPGILECPTMMPKGPLFSLFEIFLSPSKVSRLQDMLLDESDPGVLKNLWLLSPSIHSAFRKGHLKVRSRFKADRDKDNECDTAGATEAGYSIIKLYPEECSGLFFHDKSPFNHFFHRFTLRTTDPSHLPLPSRFLFNIHHSLVTALHLFSIEDKIARGWPHQAPNILGRRIQLALRTTWLLLPTFMRTSCYRYLSRMGQYLYDHEISEFVQRLPFGLYLKKCNRAQENEPNALKLVERYTSAPAPLLIDTFQEKGDTVIIMTRVRGQTIQDVFHLMSYAERDQFADDLGSVVKQLRRIPNHTPYRFANTLGGPMVDHRVPDRIFGPFQSEADFNNHLYHIGVGPDLKKSMHGREHHSVFTHSDLHPTNVLVEGGRLSGIVDWECAAFKPEYWEFTKAMYGVWNDTPREAVLRRAFDNLYSAELEVEQALWRVTPFGI